MKIRAATLDDISTVLELGELMVEESRFRPYGLNRDKAGKTVESLIKQPDQAVILLAERDDSSVVGMLAGYVVDYFFCDALVAQDKFFFVKPEARGSSAAIKLLLGFRSWVERRGAHELNINMSVAVNMDRFNLMMAKLGFQCCGSNFSLPIKTLTNNAIRSG
ncbi:MAG: hypothetical protein PHD37_06050 [Gallionellaceae bacterium]|nr:hypothetical protein [Gallionellaceae bacterium]